MTSTNPLHIVFSPSAAGTLREALKLCDRTEDVVAFADSLEMGPINPPDLDIRGAWIDEALQHESWYDKKFVAWLKHFWNLSLNDQRKRFVWLTRRSAHDFSNFLEWISRNGDTPFDLIDLTDVMIPSDKDPNIEVWCDIPSLISKERLIKLKLWDLAKPIDDEQRLSWLELWEKLKTENAPVRILTAEGLASATLTVFDEHLLRHSKKRYWTKSTFIVGTVLWETSIESFHPGMICQTGDIFLFGRIFALIDEGVLEAKGDISDVRTLLVRSKKDLTVDDEAVAV